MHLRSKIFSHTRNIPRGSLGEFVCLKRKRESTSRCSLRPEVHPAINHPALLIVLKSCHARVTLLFHAEESRTSSTSLSLRVAIKINSTICQSCIAPANGSRKSIFSLRMCYTHFFYKCINIHTLNKLYTHDSCIYNIIVSFNNWKMWKGMENVMEKKRMGMKEGLILNPNEKTEVYFRVLDTRALPVF